MASLQKINVVRYIDKAGKQVAKGTPGAKKVKEESAKWYACWREGKKQHRLPLSTDKAVSQVMLADLLKAKERGQSGLSDPHKEHLDAPLAFHVADYLEVVKSTTRSEAYHKDVARILNLFVRDAGATTLRDVTADRVGGYLAKMKKPGPTTRNYYRQAIVMFLNWCEGAGRIERNPITRFTLKTAKRGKKRERRALNADDIAKLLQTVRDYPMKSNKGGGRFTMKPENLKPAYVATLQHRGRERWLIYRLAVLTGLRRIDLSRLKVLHLELDRQPFARLNLPGDLTKNGKPARILLVPSLASDLREWIADTGKKPADVLLKVPGPTYMVKLHQSHLAQAGIPYEVDGRFADFHSLRMAGNVLLRKAGIPPKERQLFMRHGTLALTTETYDDADATGMDDVVKALANTNL